MISLRHEFLVLGTSVRFLCALVAVSSGASCCAINLFLKPSANRRQRASLGTQIHYDSTQIIGEYDVDSGEHEDHVRSERESE